MRFKCFDSFSVDYNSYDENEGTLERTEQLDIAFGKDGRNIHEDERRDYSDDDEDINFIQGRRSTLIICSKDEDDERSELDEESTGQYLNLTSSASGSVIQKQEQPKKIIENNLR